MSGYDVAHLFIPKELLSQNGYMIGYNV